MKKRTWVKAVLSIVLVLSMVLSPMTAIFVFSAEGDTSGSSIKLTWGAANSEQNTYINFVKLTGEHAQDAVFNATSTSTGQPVAGSFIDSCAPLDVKFQNNGNVIGTNVAGPNARVNNPSNRPAWYYNVNTLYPNGRNANPDWYNDWINNIPTSRFSSADTNYIYSGTFIKYADGTIKEILPDVWSPQQTKDTREGQKPRNCDWEVDTTTGEGGANYFYVAEKTGMFFAKDILEKESALKCTVMDVEAKTSLSQEGFYGEPTFKRVQLQPGDEIYVVYAQRGDVVVDGNGTLPEDRTVETVDNDKVGFNLYAVDFTSDAKGRFGDNYGVGGSNQGAYTNTLVNGYPVTTGEQGTVAGRSLGELFGSEKAVNHLFIKEVYDQTHHLYFSSDQYFATLVTKEDANGNPTEFGTDYTVYTDLGTPYWHWHDRNRWDNEPEFAGVDAKNDMFYYERGNFMPYNTLDYGWVVHRDMWDAYGQPYTGSSANKVLYSLKGDAYDTRCNYYHGLHGDGDFLYFPDGQYRGEDMVFKFTGDDDMIVYVDDVLVLDLAGIHDALSGEINFATGEVTVQVLAQPGQQPVYNNTTIKAMFEAAGKTWDDSAYSLHNLKFFYMERGQGASNLKLDIMIPFMSPGYFTLEKELQNVQKKYSDTEFAFQAFKQTTKGWEPITVAKDANGFTVNSVPATVTITNDDGTTETKTEQNVFYLRQKENLTPVGNELLLFDLDDEDQYYYVVELGTVTGKTYGWVQEKDYDGNPIYLKDEEDNYILDDNGNKIPVYAQAKDDEGNLIFDDDGNPVYEKEVTGIQVARFMENDPYNEYSVFVCTDPSDEYLDPNSEGAGDKWKGLDKDRNGYYPTEPIQPDKRQRTIILNRYNWPGQLEFTKKIPAGTEVGENDTFDFMVYLESDDGKLIPYVGDYVIVGKEDTVLTTEDGKITIKPDEVVLIDHLMDGENFLIFELGPDGDYEQSGATTENAKPFSEDIFGKDAKSLAEKNNKYFSTVEGEPNEVGIGRVIGNPNYPDTANYNPALVTITNVIPDSPEKSETAPYEGTGELGGVNVGDEITYEIAYKNYKDFAATVTIKDKLDKNVEFVSASDNGVYDAATHTVTWTLRGVAAGKEDKVTLTVKVLEGARKSNGGEGKVINGPDTTVQVGNDNEYGVETVTNPVPEPPVKTEITPYTGTGDLGGVKVGDKIKYTISYENYKSEAANVIIIDTLDKNVKFVSASDNGVYDAETHTVTWTLEAVESGTKGEVTLTVQVLEGALEVNKVENGEDTTVQVGNDNKFTVETVTNPVPEPPVKEETAPYEGTGELGAVKVGDEITYTIKFKNYKDKAADIEIVDTLDKNVKFISASDNGVYDAESHTVTWTLEAFEAGKEGNVTLTVEVLEGAMRSNGGNGFVVNGPDTTVQVGNDSKYNVKTVTNPVPEPPVKQELLPYKGTGELGAVKVGDRIVYEIIYENYKNVAADIVIVDKLDENVKFFAASDNGKYDEATHTVTWTLKNVAAAKKGTVILSVEVLESALTVNKVENGEGTTVKVGNDSEYNVETVTNPVPEPPVKEEVTPYEGTGDLGAVKVGDEITYTISYKNYKSEAADVVIVDTLDKNVKFISASDDGVYDADTHTVTWTLEAVEAGKEDKVTLTVEVLEGALKSNGGEGKVINGPDTTVQVGNDNKFTVETVTNPVPEPPVKEETAPYKGTGKLGAVKVGDPITYQISYENYKDEAADVIIVDTLDENVKFAGASDNGKYDEATHTVTWTIEGVEAGTKGKVTLTVEVLESALTVNKVENGEDTTVKVGNDNEFTVETITNPVPEPPAKEEVTPYEGTGYLGSVEVGDNINYQITYKNYKDEAADVVIVDTLDKNVKFISASDDGVYDAATHTVTWTLKAVEAGKEDKVILTVEVLEGALKSKGGEGKVVNGPDTTVQVGNDNKYNVETVTNPVPDNPEKKEVAPYEGVGTLGAVKVGDNIVYEISYENYLDEAADVVIVDTLDKNVKFVFASDDGVYDAETHTVTWTLKGVAAGKEGKVTLTVEVLESALTVNKVENGEGTTVQVGNDRTFTVETVTNPVPEPPVKAEITPYEGTGTLGEVKVGDKITYSISYKNYKDEAADVIIVDKLDKNVKFISASDGGVYDAATHTVTWTLKAVEAGKEGKVTLTVEVLEGALKSKKGPGEVINGPGTTVQVGNDDKYEVETVINPVKDDTDVPKTGDYIAMVGLILLIIAAMAGCGICIAVPMRRRKFGSDK